MSRFDASIVLSAGFLFLASACDDPPAKPSPSATATAPATATTTASAAEKKPAKPARPEKLETDLTDARREKIEKAHPEARGFVVMKELEERLKTKKLKESKDGIKAFDGLAKGKWVLFTGPLVEAKDGGFSIGVSYTPLVEGDRVGLSRQFFLVALSDVKGYDLNEMKDGTMVVVLAKYDGSAKGGPGFELVAANEW